MNDFLWVNEPHELLLLHDFPRQYTVMATNYFRFTLLSCFLLVAFNLHAVRVGSVIAPTDRIHHSQVAPLEATSSQLFDAFSTILIVEESEEEEHGTQEEVRWSHSLFGSFFCRPVRSAPYSAGIPAPSPKLDATPLYLRVGVMLI